MQIYAAFLAIAAFLISSIAGSQSFWPEFQANSYQYSSEPIALQSQFLSYHDAPYYVYNVNSGVNTAIPTTVLTEEKSQFHDLTPYSFFYGSPVYNLRFPLNPVYPVYKGRKPMIPQTTPPPMSTTTTEADESNDGVEKLDMKAEEAGKETKEPNENTESKDNDSVTVEAV